MQSLRVIMKHNNPIYSDQSISHVFTMQCPNFTINTNPTTTPNPHHQITNKSKISMAMTKLTLLVATFALFFLMASASLRATIEIEEENPRGQDCQQQCQQQDELSHCQMYMRQQSQRRGGGGWDNQQQQQHERECCSQLQQLDSRCRCQCLEQAARRQQQQGQYGREEVVETASNIPRICQVEPRRGCDFGRSRYISV